jgi:hypothetical protein
LTVTTNLVAELVRAAKGIGKLPHSERRRLLQRGVAASGALLGLTYLFRLLVEAPMDDGSAFVGMAFSSPTSSRRRPTLSPTASILASSFPMACISSLDAIPYFLHALGTNRLVGS